MTRGGGNNVNVSSLRGGWAMLWWRSLGGTKKLQERGPETRRLRHKGKGGWGGKKGGQASWKEDHGRCLW